MEMTGILFDAGDWLRGRAVLRGRYLSARDPRPELHTAKHESPWYGGLNRTLTRARARTRALTLTRYGGPAAARHARQELHIAARPTLTP